MAGFRVHVAASLDGFIADQEGSTAFLAHYPSLAASRNEFLAGVSTLVMGRSAYARLRVGGDWPYGGRRAIVVTSHSLDTAPDEVEPWLGDVSVLADTLKTQSPGDVWVVGDGKAISAFLDLGVIDRLDFHLVPHLLGQGLPLFRPGDIEARLSLLTCRALGDGVVRLTYRAR